ncbi:2-hydroxyacylsphingosine 1-beta-galactosyltransferase-like [Oculina patagonica]
MASLCYLILLFTIKSAFSAKIAGLAAVSSGSHYFVIRNALQELASRGHEVVMLVSSDRPEKPNEKIPHKTYQVPYKPGYIEDMLIRPALEENKYMIGWNMNRIQLVMCECLLNSSELLQELKSFDLILFDSTAPCGVLLSQVLDIQTVIIVIGPPNYAFAIYHMVPLPLSYVPMRGSEFTSKMTFMQRVGNVGMYGLIKVLLNLLFVRPWDALKVKFNIKPERNFQEGYGDAEMVIFLADFALEFPQPLLPGNIMVGPITVQTPKQLPPDFEKFVNSSGGHGFIMASFGSYVESVLHKDKLDMLAEAFGKLKQKVLWRLKDYVPPSLSPNIKVVDWLPQNDLLAHKYIKAFVSHVGHNSLYESAYHGVPVVAVPLFSDQFPNAKKAEQFGLGIVVDHETVDAQQLFEAIERVVTEPRFKMDAMRISRLMKDSPRTPVEKTGDWIEYVLRHGGARHLRAQVFNIPWYQYYLLDVMAFLVAIVTLVVMVIRLACRCMCRVCCKKGDSKTKKE